MAKVVNPVNVHFALDQKFDQIVKNDVFDGEVLYPILSQMKGVTKDMAAGVLLAFKNREDRLRLTVKLPRDVESLPLGAKMRLVNAVLERERVDESRLVAHLVLRKAEAAADRGDLALRATGDASPAGVAAAEFAGRHRRNRVRTLKRVTLVLLAASAITVNVLFFLWDEVSKFNPDEVAAILKLSHSNVKGGEHLQATVTPPLPYLEIMPRKMEKLCAAMMKRGIGAVDLFDGSPPKRTMIANCFHHPGIDVPRIWVSPGLVPMPLDEIKKLPANDPLRARLLPKQKPKPIGIFPEATPPPPPPPPPASPSSPRNPRR
ncbi:MAG: hypothetical protein HYY84_09365 [Deltaproteobacteria bacterium]|nr:hypothetical protein [Deltaproteobacteria bacterium]